MKKFFIAVAVCVFLLLIASAGGMWWWFSAQKPLTSSDTAISCQIEVPKGTTLRAVADNLKHQGLIRSNTVFYYQGRLDKVQIKSGTYTVSSDMSYNDIVALLQTGTDAQLIVSIPEGLTASKIGSILEEKGVVSQSDFLSAVKNKELIDSYHIPAESLEGYLFPDTYYFLPDSDPEDVVRKITDNFFEKIRTIEGIENLTDEELFELVTLASIVEREYRVASEAPIIASVFKNRIENNIGLYSCATIEYIITEIQGKPHPEIITNKDLKIENPYNTYMWRGLPPGPISNPGLVALTAVAHPAQTDYFYFRLIDPQTGTHHFSKDFEEHIDVGNLYTKKVSSN